MWPTTKLNPLLIFGLLTLTSLACNCLQLPPGDHSSSAPSGPRIIITPSTSTVHIDINGPPKVFTCKTAGDTPSMFGQLRWSGPDSLDNFDELRQRHSVTEEIPNSNIWDLEFKHPKVGDSGVYYCRGKYHSSDEHNASVTIKVVNSIKLDNCNDRQFLVQGSTNGKITCRITGDSPRVTLRKNNQLIDQTDTRYKWDNDDGLVINGEVDASDAGIYRVSVTNEVTGDRRVHSIDVQVHTRPEIIGYNESSTDASEFYGIEGNKAELKCRAIGNPQPLVYWLDPKLRNLTSVSGYHVNPESGSLLIDRVNKVDDDGYFQCFAYNTIGTTSRRVSMAVYTKPQITNFNNKTVDENSEVTFECRATGNPKPNFSIRKHGINQVAYRVGDGIVRDISTDPEGGGSNVFVHRLTIMANQSHFGQHFCNATNRADTAEMAGYLFVNYKPDLSLTPREQFVKLGQRITVTCIIRAFPKPTVSWYSDNTQILNVDTNFKTTEDQTHVITMSPPSAQQTAFNRFTCRAQNIMGQSEQTIIPRYTTAPGLVVANILERRPTMVKLQLTVPNDGGDRIKFYKYRAEGRTLDIHNPVYIYREDRQNDTLIEASLNPTVPYTIPNLLPYFVYRISVTAINDVGEGPATDIRIETERATRPEPPVIIKPSTQSLPAIPSEYQNGYLLKWSPPDSDNGDPIQKYIIKFGKMARDAMDMPVEDLEERIVEQMHERPMYARIGPLLTNQRYRIQLQARNKYGDSEPTQIVVQTLVDRPAMSEFQPVTLTWLVEPSTPTLLALLVVAVVLLIAIDLIFCFYFQIGVSYVLKSWCYPSKTNSVISDKTYTFSSR